MEERTKLQKIVLVALAAMILVFGVLTGVSRAHKGVRFDGALLEQTVVPDQTTYTGKVHGEAVTITVNNDGGPVTSVRYDTETVHDVYTMEYPLAPSETAGGYWENGVRVLKNGQVLFEGAYDRERDVWYDADGQGHPYFDIDVIVGGQVPAAPTELEYGEVARFALGPELTARGSWAIYALLVFLTLLMMLDVAWPTTLFYLEHCCDVKDPEPSDFYLATQKVGWVVSPFLLLAGYIWTLRQFP